MRTIHLLRKSIDGCCHCVVIPLGAFRLNDQWPQPIIIITEMDSHYVTLCICKQSLRLCVWSECCSFRKNYDFIILLNADDEHADGTIVSATEFRPQQQTVQILRKKVVVNGLLVRFGLAQHLLSNINTALNDIDAQRGTERRERENIICHLAADNDR